MNKRAIILIATALIILLVVIVLAFNSGEDEIIYEQPTQNILDNLEDQKLLSSNGLRVKRDLIQGADSSGKVVETENFFVVYLEPPLDRFVVEIKSRSVLGAKSSAISWLKSNGLSENDICGLPVVFQVGMESGLTAEQIKNISAIPSFCIE